MKNHLFSVICWCSICLLCGSVAAVEFSAGLKGGGTTYFGDIDRQQIAPVSGLALDLWISQKFAVQVLTYFGQVKAEHESQYFQSDIVGAGTLLKIRPFEKAAFSPHLLGGVEYFKMDPSDKEGDPLPNQLLGAYKLHQVGLPVGGGFSIFPSPKVSFDLDVLYHFTFTDYLDDLAGGTSDDRYLTATIGITLYFNKVVQEPPPPPVAPSPKAVVTPLDSDGDGIPDDRDGAPFQPEDIDGFQDEDGIPDPDNDGDGIPDVRDECPGTDQTVAAGIDTRETFNNYEDADGCPDVKPEIAVEKGQSIVLEGVYFATGSTNLTPNSMFILDKVYRTLLENPAIEVEIRGYTDNTGSYQVNMRLSKERADAVKIYLMNKGIDAARIRTIGYGPENPIAPNTTSEGRARNRRIEFFRIK